MRLLISRPGPACPGGHADLPGGCLNWTPPERVVQSRADSGTDSVDRCRYRAASGNSRASGKDRLRFVGQSRLAAWFADWTYARIASFVASKVPVGQTLSSTTGASRAGSNGSDPWAAGVVVGHQTFSYAGSPATTILFRAKRPSLRGPVHGLCGSDSRIERRSDHPVTPAAALVASVPTDHRGAVFGEPAACRSYAPARPAPAAWARWRTRSPSGSRCTRSSHSLANVTRGGCPCVRR